MKAMKLTEESFEIIAPMVNDFWMSDIKDAYEYHAEDGVATYVILEEDVENKVIVAIPLREDDFRVDWKFADKEINNKFEEITYIGKQIRK